MGKSHILHQQCPHDLYCMKEKKRQIEGDFKMYNYSKIHSLYRKKQCQEKITGQFLQPFK